MENCVLFHNQVATKALIHHTIINKKWENNVLNSEAYNSFCKTKYGN